MKILIDIGHPGHVHYFKNFYKIMKSKAHDFLFISRDKEVSFALLNHYNIPYISRGKGKKSFLGKLIYMLYADFIILKSALKFKPDLFLSFGSPYAAQISFLTNKPNIVIDDTEVGKFEQFFYKLFSKVILTPSSFYKNFGEKQVRFDGFMELCYLHSSFFTPDNSVLNKYNLSKSESYSLIRFVSWDASHDRNETGLTYSQKKNIIKTCLKYGKVIISSEGKLPKEFQKYELKIMPEDLHQLLSFASLYVGEGATTASECAMLGTPSIYINSIDAGTIREQQKYGLLTHFKNGKNVDQFIDQLLKNIELNKEYELGREKMLNEKINLTPFLVWFVENYPESLTIMKENPDYQYRFK